MQEPGISASWTELPPRLRDPLLRALQRTRSLLPEVARLLLSPLRFAGAVLLSALIARAWLYRELRRVVVTPFTFDPGCCDNFQLAHWAHADVQLAFTCAKLTLPVAALGVVAFGFSKSLRSKLAGLVHLLAVLALACLGLVYAAYYKVAFVMHAQLDYGLLVEASQNGFGLADISEYLALSDLLLVLAPVASYLALRASSLRARALQGLGLAGVAGLLLAIPDPGLHAPRRALCVNPVSFLATNAIDNWNKPRPFANFDVAPSPNDLAALGLQELTQRPLPRQAGLAEQSLSVVVVILESVGRRYAFNDGADPIMPRLSALRDSSLYFAQHLSTSNSSGNSIFSVFTGLYPAPSRAVFATQADVHLPVLHNYLPWIHDAFLVTPGRVNSYFPRGLLTNAGMDLHDRYNLGVQAPRPYPGWWAADERDGVDAFLARMEHATGPFLGVYYSYAAHNLYYDHGPEFRVMPDLSNDFHRYNNNLRLLDTQLERILAAIESRQERVLLVVLGDHGEAFGQHQANYKHSTNSFEENFETFALVHLPGTFPVRKIEERTQHIDLLPTILSGLGVPFEASQFQGRDLLHESAPRPYVFLYGNEDTLSSIADSGIKLQLSYKKNFCRVFNLMSDPSEQLPLACSPYLEQVRHTGMFHAFQPEALRRYQKDWTAAAGSLPPSAH